MPATCLRVSKYSSADSEGNGLSEMKSLLFALGLALCCFVQADQDQQLKNVDCNKYMGRWWNIGIGCGSQEVLDHVKNMTVFYADVSRLKENVFSVTIVLHMPDGCKNITCQFKREEDGKYHIFPDDTVETLDSVIFLSEQHVISTVNVSSEFRVTTFHSRTITPGPEVLQKFKEECKRLGYREDQIVILNPNAMCKEEK